MLGQTACEDYKCDVQDVETYYKNKTIGKKPDIEKWNRIQEKLNRCNTTFEDTSSLFIEYTKNYPNFLIDDDTKYKVGEHPKKEETGIVVSTSVSTLYSSSSEGEFRKRTTEKSKGESQKVKKDSKIDKVKKESKK